MKQHELSEKIARCAAGIAAIDTARASAKDMASIWPGVFVASAQFDEVAAALADDKAAAEAEFTQLGD